MAHKSSANYRTRQRKKAEAIIAASGAYSAAFRKEVKDALDTAPFKLPVLFREADRIDARRETAGRSLHAEMRRSGIPIRTAPDRAIARSPRKHLARDAEMIEALFQQEAAGKLDEEWTGRASLINDILFELSNNVGIDTTHPALVRAYMLAISAKWGDISDVREAVRMLTQIRDLMNGCTQARLEEIDAEYQPHLYGFESGSEAREYYDSRCTFERQQEIDALREARKAGAVVESKTHINVHIEAPDISAELNSAREQLAALEYVPENEGVRMDLESRIYSLGRQVAALTEWPDVIGGEQ